MKQLCFSFLVGLILVVTGLVGSPTAAQNPCTGPYDLVPVQTNEQQAVDVNPYWKDDRITKKR